MQGIMLHSVIIIKTVMLSLFFHVLHEGLFKIACQEISQNKTSKKKGCLFS